MNGEENNLPGGETGGDRHGEAGLLLIKAGKLLPLLLAAALAAALFITGAAAAAAALGLTVASAVTAGYFAEKKAAARFGIPKSKILEAESCVSSGEESANGLFIPRWLRSAPAAVGAVAALVAAVVMLAGEAEAEAVVNAAVACLCAGISLNLGAAAAVSLSAASAQLSMLDIRADRPEVFGAVARSKLLMADESVFCGYKNAELRGFYTDGNKARIAALNMKEHMPLIIGAYYCDDGSLGEAYCIRETLGDLLLRLMRSTPMEHQTLTGFTLLRRIPYTDESGFISAFYNAPSGDSLTCTAGRPDVLMPLCKHIYRDGAVYPMDEASFKRIRNVVSSARDTGEKTVLICAGLPESMDLTFIGCLFFETPFDRDSGRSVAALAETGVTTLVVSNETEKGALHKAAAAGITGDSSRVLTSARLDTFKDENLFKAAGHARLAAEMDDAHRDRLGRLMGERYGSYIAASRSGRDVIFKNASVVISNTESDYGTDCLVRRCRVNEVTDIVRIAKSACRAFRKSAVQLLSSRLAAALAFFLVVVFMGRAPLLPLPAAMLVLLLPLGQSFVISSSRETAWQLSGSTGPVLQEELSIPKIPGRLLSAWAVFAALLAAVLSVFVYERLLSSTGGGAAAHGFALTLSFAVLATGMTVHVWGKTLFLYESYRGRGLLISTAVTAVLAAAIPLVGPLSSFLGFAKLPMKAYPGTVLPAVLIILIYEFGRIISLRYERRRAKDGA